MLPLGFSALDVVLVIGLGVAGFIVVALVCAAVLAMLHLVLPATDSGAAELDARREDEGGEEHPGAPGVDTGADA